MAGRLQRSVAWTPRCWRLMLANRPDNRRVVERLQRGKLVLRMLRMALAPALALALALALGLAFGNSQA